MECGTHAVIAARLGTIYQGERELASHLRGRVTGEMLVIADRGFHSYQAWQEFLPTGAALLRRVAAGLILDPLEVLPDGSYLAEISNRNSRSSRCRIPLAAVGGDPALATHIPVRVIEYRIDDTPDTETIRLITSILDPDQADAAELAAAYHQRWEIETAFREIEVGLLDGHGLRSKTPELVRQEIWGLLLAHYALRAFATEAADMEPDRISFTRTLHLVRRQLLEPPAFSPRRGTPPP